MTREEIIRNLEYTMEKHKNDTVNTFETNISAMCKDILDYLEQQPCEDCISRQEALNVVHRYFEHYLQLNDDICLDGLRSLPSVTPKEKIGHWILQPSNKEQGERDFIWWKCSECGQVIFSETKKDRREYHAYCGRCGAKMVEPQESEDKE